MRIGCGGQLTTLAPSKLRGARPSVGERLRAGVIGIDWILLAGVLAISGLGLFVLRAATADDVPGDADFFFSRQLVFVLIGIVLMAVATQVDPGRLARFAWPLWWGMLTVLALVALLASAVRGASSWFEVGPISVQPSELGKVVLIVVLASLAVERRASLGTVRYSLFLAVAAAVPIVAVLAQPDIGTAAVYGAILAAILFVAGVPWGHLATAAAALVGALVAIVWALPALGLRLLEDYQVERLTAFVSSDAEAGETGFQLDQSLIAVGSGGALGKGPEDATQTITGLLPDHHTDFIFASAAEMLGFVGAGGVILLFGLLLWRGLRIVAHAATPVEQLVAGAIVAMIAFQAFVNIAMTVRLMPITGLPLPFMSYGGSHTLATFIAVGLLLGIHRRRSPLTV